MRSLMLLSIGLSVTVSLVPGCSEPIDLTENRGDNVSSLDYPAGPYGYVESSVIENYKFLGKHPVAGDYASQPLGNLFLDFYHDDPGANLVLIEGSANWCYYCNEEAPTIEKIAVDNYDKGVRVVTVLAEGLTQGVPSTEEDIARWVKKHKFKQQSMAIDPELRLFQFADSSAFPLHIVLDTKTMQIKWLCVGGEGGCDTKGAIEELVSQ